MLIHLKSCFLPRCAKDAPVGVFTDGKVIDAALDSMHELSKSNSKPWFLAVGLKKPHLPLAIPARFLHMQVPVGDVVTVPSIPFIQSGSSSPIQAYYTCNNMQNGSSSTQFNSTSAIPLAYQREYRRAYHGAVSFMDELFGHLVDNLEVLQIRENTIVVALSDHGWNLGDHGAWCKQSNWETIARIPLMVRLSSAGGDRGPIMRLSSLVEAIDVFPTLVELSGLDKQTAGFDKLEGTSLKPLIHRALAEGYTNYTWLKDAAYSQYPRCSNLSIACTPQGIPDNFDFMGYSVRTDKWRYTRWMHWLGSQKVGAKVSWDDAVAEELYDHRGERAGNESFAQSEVVNVLVVDPKGSQRILVDLRNRLKVFLRTQGALSSSSTLPARTRGR